MFSLIQEVLVVLLSFSNCLLDDQIKCISLNDKSCMVIPGKHSFW